MRGLVPASSILDEIRALGYTGGGTILRTFMHPLRPIIREKATVRFETAPGEQAQVDWGRVSVDWDGRKKRLYVFVMILCYSRMMYVEFTEDEKLETLMGCHVRAMEYFGGVTRTCLYDNMKTVVIGQDERGEVIWNERFSAFATHHGFILKRCQPYRAQTKGKVENGDGTTHECPIDRWRQEELKSFNLIPFETTERHRRKVSVDAMISYETNRYSVPFQWVGHTVDVQDDKNGRIRIYTGDTLLAEHIKASGQYAMVIDHTHVEGLNRYTKKRPSVSLPSLVPSAVPDVSVLSPHGV